MKALLDTNIIIAREANTVVNQDIGVLYKWLEKAHYQKCIHQITVDEIHKNSNRATVDTFDVKMAQYELLQSLAKIPDEVQAISDKLDKNTNDFNDTLLLNELYNNRVDVLITEDKKIHEKACVLGISESVFNISSFIEKIIAEHPDLVDYKVLSVKKELIGNINFEDSFFDSFRADYPGFDKWFNSKANEHAYITQDENTNTILSFLYLKTESTEELYYDINPTFLPKKRLKISSFKVISNGERLGERYLKIIFDNALRRKVDEIYVTVFNNKIENTMLINMLEEWGFKYHGTKGENNELVYLRDFTPQVNVCEPKLTYPYINSESRKFLVPIYPAYHTDLFPDSILHNECPDDFVESEPHRNSIGKVYISRSLFKCLQSGDVLVFYRTGGYYQGVISTIAIVEGTCQDISSNTDFIRKCRKRSVFTDEKLLEHWNYNKYNRPFIVYLLYVYSFPKRINLARLIQLGIIRDTGSAPRGFERISEEQFKLIIEETESDKSFIVD
jgi:predicted nucleic acid-binding protein